jgi:hypothetical protein
MQSSPGADDVCIIANLVFALPQLTPLVLSSCSPVSMLCSHMQGHVTISNDGATIMKLLDVVHPAAKTLVDVSLSQDAEVRTPQHHTHQPGQARAQPWSASGHIGVAGFLPA